MAGFRPKRQLYRLRFEGSDLDGLEVTTTSVSVGTLLSFTELADQAESNSADPSVVRKLFEQFAFILVDWNIEDDQGQPVPQTVDGLLTLDFSLVMALISKWIATLAEAPPPLPGNSSDGQPSEEASLDLANSSSSLPSSPEQT